METLEEKRLEELNLQIEQTKSTYEAILQIHSVTDRQRLRLKGKLEALEKEKQKLLQGEMIFDRLIDF